MKGLERKQDAGDVTEWVSLWLAGSIALWSLCNRKNCGAFGCDFHYSPILAVSLADGCCRSEKSFA